MNVPLTQSIRGKRNLQINISNLASTILSDYKSGNLPFAMTFFKNRFAINHQVEQTYY